MVWVKAVYEQFSWSKTVLFTFSTDSQDQPTKLADQLKNTKISVADSAGKKKGTSFVLLPTAFMLFWSLDAGNLSGPNSLRL